MCLIIAGSDLSLLDTKILRDSWMHNPDGGSVMALVDGRIVTRRGLMHYKSLLRALDDIQECTVFAIHLRFSTMGVVNAANTHGFKVGARRLMHNGHVDGYGTKTISDTNHLARVLDSMPGKHVDTVLRSYSNINRFALLSSAGLDLYGRWYKHNGLDYSNSHYIGIPTTSWGTGLWSDDTNFNEL